jgi:hypothetical protein
MGSSTTFVVDNFDIFEGPLSDDLFRIAQLNCTFIKLLVHKLNRHAFGLFVLYYLFFGGFCLGLACLYPFSSLLVKKFDKCVVGHIFPSLNEFFSLNLNIVGSFLKVFVHGLLLNRSPMTFGVHILHVGKAHISKISQLFFLSPRLFCNVKIVFILVHYLHLSPVLTVTTIWDCVNKLADHVLFQIVAWPEKFLNSFNATSFEFIGWLTQI